MADEITHIGPYEIVEQTGVGGMATVYKAYQAKLDRYVAVKVMHKSMLDDNSFLVRFEREARIVARLDHSNIVPIYDYDKHDGQPYLVMKFLEGQTLKELLNKTVLSLQEIQHIMERVANALSYAHNAGVLHRDIKPSNIIIDAEGTPYLTDFGLARIATQGESTLSTDMMLGTPHYISPEQAKGDPDINACTDVYSMGVVLYQLVTGRVPFMADTPFAIVHQHIYEDPKAPSEFDPEIPAEVDRVLLKAMAKDPEARYRTPNALMKAFNQAIETSGLTKLDDSRAERAAEAKPVIRAPIQRPIASAQPAGKGKSVIIPTLPPGATQPPTSFNAVVQEIVDRIRTIIVDLQAEFYRRKVGAKIKEALEKSTGAAKTNEAKQRIEREKAFRLINEDWGTDELSIRRRVNSRVNQRRGLFTHVLFYTIIIAAMATTQSQGQAELAKLFTDPEFINEMDGVDYLGPLATLNYALFFALMWGSGLFSHALKVFYNTGSRLEKKRQTLRKSLEDVYGLQWQDTIQPKQYKRLRKSVNNRYKQRVGLMAHFAGYGMTIAAIFIAWEPIRQVLVASPNLNLDPEWADLLLTKNIVPQTFAVIFGIFFIIRVFGVMIMDLVGGDAKEREVRQEMARERERSFIEAPKPKRAADAGIADADIAKAKRNLGKLVEAAQDSEIRRQQAQEPAVRLTGDGEFTESFIDEIQNDQQNGL